MKVYNVSTMFCDTRTAEVSHARVTDGIGFYVERLTSGVLNDENPSMVRHVREVTLTIEDAEFGVLHTITSGVFECAHRVT
jgi:hypothetical protein